MRHDALDNVTLELEYASRVNWSLLHAGVPFLFKLCVTGSLDLACELTLDLLIFSNRDNTTILLNNTRVRVTQDDVKAARNLASVSHADMVHQWLKRQAWSMGDNVEAATLSVRLPDGRAVSCPVEVSPPTYWYRAIDHAGRPTDRLPCTRVTIALRDAHPLPVISHGAHDCAEKAAYPPLAAAIAAPLAAAIAAFVDINDPYVRQDGQEDGLGSRVAEYVRVLEGEKTPSLSKVLESFYKVVLEKRNLRHVDFLHEYSPEEQAVRVLKSDRERGALCLDLVVLGCEVLESWGFSPIFILTDRGGHAVLGAWSEDKGFADGLPVCRDTQTFADLVKNKVVSVLDVTLALSQVSYDQASRDSPLAFSPEAMSGFVYAVDIVVYAVDIAAARGWPRAAPTFRILPLHRPRAVAEWVVPYLERKFPADLQRQRAHITLRSKDQAGSGEMKDDGRLEVDLEHLDDPDALFIPARCEVPGEIEDITLDPSSKWHWPPAGLPRKNGKLALAVLANGGGGKSYLCRRLAKVMATCYLSDSTPSNPVPIFYPLRQFVRGASLLESLARHVGCSGPEDLAHAANHVPLLFILDALDESDFGRAAGSPKDYEELLQPLLSLANTSVFLTGRPAMFPGAPRRFLPPDFTIVYLKDWDKTDDLTSFLRACEHIKGIQFNGGWSTFYDVVFGPSGSQNLRELAKTPLLARMIVQTRDLIEREVRSGEKKFDELDLYRKYTGHCFQRKWTLTGQDLAAAAHKEIALSMYMTGRNALSADNISIDLAAYLMRYGINIWRQFSHHGCVVYGLLVPDKEKTFRFSHLSFEHYFLAERLADELRSSLASSILPGKFRSIGTLGLLDGVPSETTCPGTHHISGRDPQARRTALESRGCKTECACQAQEVVAQRQDCLSAARDSARRRPRRRCLSKPRARIPEWRRFFAAQ